MGDFEDLDIDDIFFRNLIGDNFNPPSIEISTNKHNDTIIGIRPVPLNAVKSDISNDQNNSNHISSSSSFKSTQNEIHYSDYLMRMGLLKSQKHWVESNRRRYSVSHDNC